MEIVAKSIPMDKPAAILPADDFFVLSDLPPGPAQKRLAVVFALGIVAAFFIIVALSDNRPHPVPGFVLAFSAAMFVCDAITAICCSPSFPFCARPPFW